MNQLTTQGIVLHRTNYGEADRIVTLLTPDSGKLRVLARGVRKIKSKLAGGIELFSISTLTYIKGRGELSTLVSSRLETHFGTIVRDIGRVQLGYDLLKALDRATEDAPEPEYYTLLAESLRALDDPSVDSSLIRTWFDAQLLKLSGHAPNLHTDSNGQRLDSQHRYNFDFDTMCFSQHPEGNFSASHIKTLRLLHGQHTAHQLHQVQGLLEAARDLAPLSRTMLTTYIRT